MTDGRAVPPLRIAVLGDFDGLHTRRWLEVFVQRGHEVHAISFATPWTLHDLPAVSNIHLLELPQGSWSDGQKAIGWTEPPPPPLPTTIVRSIGKALPPNLQRFINAQRYLRAGLRRVLDAIQPDVFHAHYAVEHGYYGSFADFHPYVVSAWGSDLLVESHKPLGRMIAKRALDHADLVTANDVSLARRAAALGVPDDRIEVVHLGIDRVFLDAGERSVNLLPDDPSPPTLISDRALEPLYNVEAVIRALAGLRARLPDARLVVAGDGSQRDRLEALTRSLGLGASVSFVGRLDPAALAAALAAAHVYVSVPSSDSLALSTIEAMAAGCLPVVSSLPSNEGWLRHGVNALIVPPRDVARLTAALHEALSSTALRRAAVEPNRAKAAADGLRERNMLLMERHYYRLAGHPQAGGGEAI